MGKDGMAMALHQFDACRQDISLLPDRSAMAMAVVDIQPVRAIDDAEALRISNKIDEELKVSC